MYTESDRVKLRRWLGFPAVFLQAEPRFESAITATQSIADGGSRPDNSTETAIKGYLAELDAIEARWKALYKVASYGVTKADEANIDPLRGIETIKRIGRMYVGNIADVFGTEPRRDVFSAPPVVTERATL